jgi:hypothetical protein
MEGEQRISPPEDNFTPRGKITPWGQLRPWGQSLPLGAKLRMGLCPFGDSQRFYDVELILTKLIKYINP